MPETGEATIFDVAQAAGVSITTVSRVLNNKPDVASATRDRVRRVIAELSYTPHAQARQLAARKSRTIALLYPLDRALDQLELDFIVGAAAAAGNANFFFYFATTPINPTNLLNMYRSAQVDGVILMEIHMQDWRVDLLRQHNYPFVMVGQCTDNTGLSFVDVDLAEGIVQAYDHLVDLGHRDIAFMALSSDMYRQGYGPAVQFRAGYERAIQKHNLTSPYLEVALEVEDLYDGTLKLLAEQPRLTAIVNTHGALTVNVLRALQTTGRVVPDDFSLIGVTTELVAELFTPPLTVINVPAYTEGFQAAKILTSQLNQKPLETPQVLLPPELIVRNSTGPVKSFERLP